MSDQHPTFIADIPIIDADAIAPGGTDERRASLGEFIDRAEMRGQPAYLELALQIGSDRVTRKISCRALGLSNDWAEMVASEVERLASSAAAALTGQEGAQ